MNPTIPLELRKLTDFGKIGEKLAALKTGTARRIDEADMTAALKRRVRGQDPIVDDVSKLIRVAWGKSTRRRPIASLLCLGPPGTGKSELAKALAEYLYGDEKNALVFDGPDLSGPEAKNHLLGNPTGYVGAEQGGKLTRPMIANPKRVVVFEEIEKAYREVFDLFLAMLGDGRLVEPSSGQTADFTQSVVVMTGNAEHESLARIVAQTADPQEQASAIKTHLTSAKVFRPEIMDRFDRVYVFRPLSEAMLAEIAVMKADAAAREYGLELVRVDEDVVVELVLKALKFSKPNKVRELIRLVDETLGEPLLAAQEAGRNRVTIELGDTGAPVVRAA